VDRHPPDREGGQALLDTTHPSAELLARFADEDERRAGDHVVAGEHRRQARHVA